MGSSSQEEGLEHHLVAVPAGLHWNKLSQRAGAEYVYSELVREKGTDCVR